MIIFFGCDLSLFTNFFNCRLASQRFANLYSSLTHFFDIFILPTTKSTISAKGIQDFTIDPFVGIGFKTGFAGTIIALNGFHKPYYSKLLQIISFKENIIGNFYATDNVFHQSEILFNDFFLYAFFSSLMIFFY